MTMTVIGHKPANKPRLSVTATDYLRSCAGILGRLQTSLLQAECADRAEVQAIGVAASVIEAAVKEYGTAGKRTAPTPDEDEA